MVYLLGLGATLSVYIVYKNTTQIGFNFIKCYNYIDNYFNKLFSTNETNMIVFNTELLETSNIKLAIIETIQNNNYTNEENVCKKEILLKDTFSLIDDERMICKQFYTPITIISNSDVLDTVNIEHWTNSFMIEFFNISNITTHVIAEIEEYIFKNRMCLLDIVKWKPSIIAVSISLDDKNNIYNFTEYDITEFVNSIIRPNQPIILNNNNENKCKWINYFNFIFKNKNINIPKEKYKNITLSWTVITDDASIQTGSEITILEK